MPPVVKKTVKKNTHAGKDGTHKSSAKGAIGTTAAHPTSTKRLRRA